jgi:hypothetical protein
LLLLLNICAYVLTLYEVRHGIFHVYHHVNALKISDFGALQISYFGVGMLDLY